MYVWLRLPPLPQPARRLSPAIKATTVVVLCDELVIRTRRNLPLPNARVYLRPSATVLSGGAFLLLSILAYAIQP
jgi:hypothetical protein